MRTFVIGDIHGGFKALKQVINKLAVTPSDTFIFLGDYVDGWSQPVEVIDFLITLQQQQKCIFIRGNHDDLLLDWLRYKKAPKKWLLHGGESSIVAYKKITETKKKQHIFFLEALQNYYIDKDNRLFIHAGFTNYKGVEQEYYPKLFYWDRTLWETVVALDSTIKKENVCYPKRLLLYKEIYIGHTPVTRINATIPVNKASVWNVDTGAAFKGRLSVLDVDTKNYWQSDTLPSLYPNEKGRN